MSLLGGLREATQLWIVADSKDDDVAQLCRQLHACNTARDEMLAGKITFDDLLDVLADNEVSIDDWADTAMENLEKMDYVTSPANRD